MLLPDTSVKSLTLQPQNNYESKIISRTIILIKASTHISLYAKYKALLNLQKLQPLSLTIVTYNFYIILQKVQYPHYYKYSTSSGKRTHSQRSGEKQQLYRFSNPTKIHFTLTVIDQYRSHQTYAKSSNELLASGYFGSQNIITSYLRLNVASDKVDSH